MNFLLTIFDREEVTLRIHVLGGPLAGYWTATPNNLGRLEDLPGLRQHVDESLEKLKNGLLSRNPGLCLK